MSTDLALPAVTDAEAAELAAVGIVADPAVVAKFWSFVDQSAGPDGCWPWTRTRNPAGYGGFRPPRPAAIRASHRFAWEVARGPIPAGMHVCHRCDNPPCCNPAHLFLGTRVDNMRDMAAKGRGGRGGGSGESNPAHKLTAAQVEEIRGLLARSVARRSVASQFAVSESTIDCIARGQSWKTADRVPPPVSAPRPPTPRRVLRGEQHPAAKLTAEQVASIRAERAAGIPTRDLTARFGVSPTTVRRVVRGEGWSRPDQERPARPHEGGAS